MTGKQLDEERIAAASYIIVFYQEVMALNQHHANYANVTAELKAKYGEDAKGLETRDREILTLAVQNLRNSAQKCNIQYEAISEYTDSANTKKDNVLFNKIKEKFIIPLDDSYAYVTFLNKFLVKKIMKRILENSQDIVTKMYD